MGRNKHSIAKEIEPSDPTELQVEKAQLGKLHLMSEEAEAIRIIREDMQVRCFHLGGMSHEEGGSRQILTEKVMEAVERGDSEYLHNFAELLEMISEGKYASPIESFLAHLKANSEEYPEDQNKAFWIDWPFTVSKLKQLCAEATGKDYSTPAVRAAADRVGVPYSDGRGRPIGRRTREKSRN